MSFAVADRASSRAQYLDRPSENAGPVRWIDRHVWVLLIVHTLLVCTLCAVAVWS